MVVNLRSANTESLERPQGTGQRIGESVTSRRPAEVPPAVMIRSQPKTQGRLDSGSGSQTIEFKITRCHFFFSFIRHLTRAGNSWLSWQWSTIILSTISPPHLGDKFILIFSVSSLSKRFAYPWNQKACIVKKGKFIFNLYQSSQSELATETRRCSGVNEKSSRDRLNLNAIYLDGRSKLAYASASDLIVRQWFAFGLWTMDDNGYVDEMVGSKKPRILHTTGPRRRHESF